MYAGDGNVNDSSSNYSGDDRASVDGYNAETRSYDVEHVSRVDQTGCTVKLNE